MHHRFIFISLLLIILSCKKEETLDIVPDPDQNIKEINFGPAQNVVVAGYAGQLMEPFISRDGSLLFFNNRHNDGGSADIHWAIKNSPTEFEYQGKVEGVNTEDFEGAPSLDSQGNLYFVSTNDYEVTLKSVYTGEFSNGIVTGKRFVENISKDQAGWVNFDVEVSEDGNNLYLVDGLYDEQGGPYEADLFLATLTENGFVRVENDNDLFQNINTGQLEYAAAISDDELELYFTRLESVFDPNPESQILVSSRSNTTEPFGTPQLIDELEGFVEGATLTPGNAGLYYHKKVNDRFELFFRERL